MSIISIGTISTMSVTLTSTTTTTTMKINSMGCFHCQSVNGSNPVCDDPFNSTRAFYEGYYQSSCLSGMKDRAGLYPSSACLKLKGYHSEFLSPSSQTRASIQTYFILCFCSTVWSRSCWPQTFNYMEYFPKFLGGI